MLIVALAFILVFLFRDVQALATRDKAILMRFATYAVMVVATVAILAGSGDGRSRILYLWTRRDFALAAVMVQVAELAAGIVLRKFALGRYSWIGCVLPAPAFLVALFILSLAIQDRFIALDISDALKIVTATWLVAVGACVMALIWFDNPWEDRRFINDFALMTGCTALIFVPFGLF
jgi:hypothetical protein